MQGVESSSEIVMNESSKKFCSVLGVDILNHAIQLSFKIREYWSSNASPIFTVSILSVGISIQSPTFIVTGVFNNPWKDGRLHNILEVHNEHSHKAERIQLLLLSENLKLRNKMLYEVTKLMEPQIEFC